MDALLPGELGYVFLVSILDAVLLSWVVLAWYRRSVRRLMCEPPTGIPDAGGTRVATPAPPAPQAPISPGPLAFALYDTTQHTGSDGSEPAPSVSLRRLVVAYCVGAALQSAVITAFQLGAESPPLPFVAWFTEWWINAWPLVPTLAVLLVRDRGSSLRLAVGYVVAGAGAVALVTLVGQVLRGAFNTAPLTNVFWMFAGMVWAAMVPLVLLLLIGWRRTRAVAPLALAATLVFGFGSLAFREALVRGFNLSAIRSAILALAGLTSTDIAHYGLFMLASLPVGWVAWRMLRWLASGYDGKRFSDVQLLIDCWWVVVTADEIATTLADDYGLAGVAAGLLAFAAYRVTVAIVLRTSAQAEPARAGRRLLLLRVFGYEARTESLFDRVAQRWRFHGPVQLIAGVDLAARTVDPGDVLSFLNGRLAANYLATAAEVPHRVERLDFARDPDGRHRVNELFCHDHTWRAALEALLDVSDTVLMDLRSFSAQNSGCVFELQQLVRRVPSDNVVLVCDDTTDLALLGRILGDAWNVALVDGCAKGSGTVALVRMQKTAARREFGILMQRLLGIGKPQRLFRPGELPAALA